ncbi:MAG: GGDEF domain-containing protein [Firmicutes bacterium]|nr:GGDEF domain-containing protein [Bacillota bacterium]
MMELRSVLIANGTGLFLMIMLLIVSRAKIQRRGLEDRVFMIMVIGVMIACFMEAFSYCIDGRLFAGARAINLAANTYLFAVNSLLSFSILIYFDLSLYGDPARIKKVYKTQIIVATVMFLITILNIFVPIVFRISEANRYSRLPFSYAYLLVIAYFTYCSWRTTNRYEKENGVKAFLKVEMFLIPVIIGAAVQFSFYGLSLGWLASAVGLVCLYMMQQNETAYIDPVTDIYNRQYMSYLISSWVRTNCSIAGMMIDIDDFKKINDQFGHAEGDAIIRELAARLTNAGTDNEMVFRFAGDEFIVLKKAKTREALEPYIERMLAEIDQLNRTSDKAYHLAVSYGTSLYDPQDSNLDKFMKDMDDRMYAMKSSHHLGIKD